MLYEVSTNNSKLVVDSFGAEIVSFVSNNKEYIWQGDPNHWEGHSPILFPFVSALKNKEVKYGGKTYHFDRKHGFARKSEFSLFNKTSNSLTFLLTSQEKTKESYPYDFELYVTHYLFSDGYKTEAKIVCKDENGMQFCIGFHPAFALDGSVDNYELIFDKNENSDLYYTDSDSLTSDKYKFERRIVGNKFELNHNDFDIDCYMAKDLISSSIKLLKKGETKGLTVDISESNVVVIWSPPKKNSPFICIEPCIGIAADINETGDFENKPYRKVLNNGEEFITSYSVKVD